MSRTKNIARNGFYSIISYILTAILGFVNRRFFADVLGSEILGYESLFSNIFGILAISEITFGSVVNYALYAAVAEDDSEEISRLMQCYKVFYRLIGLAILVMGILILPIMPWMISGNTVEMSYIYQIYLLRLFGYAANYLLVYRRFLFNVSQKLYIPVRIEAICTIVMVLLQIASLVVFGNYLIYTFLTVFFGLFTNVIVALRYRREFPKVHSCKIGREYIRTKGFDEDIKNNFVGAIASTIFNSTDSIVISAILSVSAVGLYSNYYMVFVAVNAVFQNISSGVVSAVGDYIHREPGEEVRKLYRAMNSFYFYISSFMVLSYIALFQPFISLWLGDAYLLPFSVVIAISANAYIEWQRSATSSYRLAVGHFEQDRNYKILSAVLNIVLSIGLAYQWGVVGVIIGTIVGNLMFWLGGVKVVYRNIILEGTRGYWIKEILRAVLVVAEAVVIYAITSSMLTGFVGLVLRELVVVVLCLIVDAIITLCTVDGRVLREYAKVILGR